MRTVTFSDERVGETLEEKFICTWENRVGAFHDCDPATEQRLFRRYAEAYTTRNICTFFLTPDLQVLHYISGYYAPQLFLEEAAFALKLHKAVLDSDGRPREDADARFKQMHASRARRLNELTQWLGSLKKARALDELWAEPLWDIQYDTQKHRHTRRCAWPLMTAYRYIALVHEDFALGRKGTNEPHGREQSLVGPPLPPEAVEIPKADNTFQKRGWRSVRINVIRTRPLTKRKKQPIPTRTGRQSIAQRRAVKAMPILNEVRHDYRFGNRFAEERSRRSVKVRVR